MRERSRFLLEQVFLLLLYKSFFICLSYVSDWLRIELFYILDFDWFTGLVWIKFWRHLLFVWQSLTTISWHSSDLYSFDSWPISLFWAFQCFTVGSSLTNRGISKVTLLAIRISSLLAFGWFCCRSCFPLKSDMLWNSVGIYWFLAAASRVVQVFILFAATSMNTFGIHLGNLSQRNFKLLIAAFWSFPHLSCIPRRSFMLRILRNAVWYAWLVLPEFVEAATRSCLSCR